ncbi:MAG: hypothetical protein EA409_03075 [Saprospirales bacterium]|nr:MAG: hypothetical protein EA409_03075 [Saprospirales bacterium]
MNKKRPKVKSVAKTSRKVSQSSKINTDVVVFSASGGGDLKVILAKLKAIQSEDNSCSLIVPTNTLDGEYCTKLELKGIKVLLSDDVRATLAREVKGIPEDQDLLLVDADTMPLQFDYFCLAEVLNANSILGNTCFKFPGFSNSGYLPAIFGNAGYIGCLLSFLDSEAGLGGQMTQRHLLLHGTGYVVLPTKVVSGDRKGVSGPGIMSKFKFLTFEAIAEMRARTHMVRDGFAENPAFRFLFFAWMVFSLIGMTALSQNAGISGDEYRYIDQAEKVYNYFATFGSDKSAVSQQGIDPQHYNAQTFDNLLFAVQKWIGLEAESFGFRHFWNAVVGWIAVLFTALIALRLGGGYRMALLVALLLVLSPRFLGHSYNNHRDIPMAATVVFAFYWMIPFLRSLPRIDHRAALWVVVGVAAAYSLRLGGGVLLTGYLLFFTAVFYLIRIPATKWLDSSNLSLAGDMGLKSIVIGLLAYVLGLLTWPFGLESPVRHTLEVLDATANIGVSLRQVFEGEEIFSSAMPWYYVPRYMQLTIPIVVLSAFLVGILMLKKFTTRRNIPELVMLVSAIVLPLFYACFMTSNHYGGWRHFIFVYPFIVLLAALGIEVVYRTRKKTWEKYWIWAVLAFGLFFPVKFIVENHPYEYIYYNELIGGTGGAAGFYELDYSLNSLREASDWLIENVVRHHDGDKKLRIATNDRRTSLYYFRDYLDKVEVVYTRYYEKSRANWDYATFYSSFISPFQIRTGLWPPEETIYSVVVDGAVVGAVVRRVSRDDYAGNVKLDSGKPVEALVHFLQYLEKDPNNVEVWTSMADAYLYIEEYEGALSAAEVALELLPGYGPVLEYKGGALLNLGRYEEAVEAFDQLLEDMPHHFVAQYFKAAALFRMGRYHEAIEAGRMSVGYNPNFRLAYQLLAECYRALGDPVTAERILQQMEQRLQD